MTHTHHQAHPLTKPPPPDLCIKHFRDLTAPELFAIYKLRTAVFVVEQRCPYQEVDDADKTAWHLWLREGEKAGFTAVSPEFLEDGIPHIKMTMSIK